MHRFRYVVIALLMFVAAAPAAAWAQTNAKEILALPAAKLVEILKSPDAPVFDKAKACQRLAVVGTKDAVPALVALLPDEKLNLYARFGLEGIPGPAVDAALREAATKLQGRQLVGVIDSIGQRKDPQSVGILKGLLGDSDPTVASAAAGALGRIGTPEAANVLLGAAIGDMSLLIPVADGCLACADRLVADGRKAEAVALYDGLIKARALPAHIKVAALGGLVRLRPAEVKDLLLAQIRNPDKAFFNLGLAAARETPGADITAALAGELEKLPPERQALLLRALGERKEPVPLPVVLAASKSKSAAVREAAIRVLARHGDASAVALPLEAALGEGEVAAAAKEGLKGISGQEVDAAIAAKLSGADAKAKAVLFELVGARRLTAAEPAVRAALSDADESVRLAAITAMGQLVELKDLELLISRALTGAGAEGTTAQRALRTAALRMGDREGCAARLAECLKGTSAVNQGYLLELLGRISGPKALETVTESAKSSDPAVKDAATRVLGSWVNPDAAPSLLEIAKSDPDPKYQIRALRGYIRIARQLQLPEAKRLDMFRTAMEVAKRAEEKQLALDILTRIPSARTLQLAVSHLDEPALKDAAAQAAVRIAPKLVGRDSKAVAEAMQKVADSGVGGNAGTRAKQLLDQAKGGAK